MSIFFEHEGLTYELPDGTSPEVAKQKILTHLGKQNTPSFPKENSNQPGILEYLNPANMYDAIVAGAQKDLGNEEKYKERIKSLDTRLKTGVNQSIGDTAKGVGTGLIDLVGGVPAMLAGAIQGVGSTIANKSADVGYKAGEQTMHEFMPSTWLGLDTNNSTYQGMMAPVAPIMEGIDTAGTGYGEIARVSGANPTLQKNIAATVKGSLMGGLMAKGGIETYSKLNELKRKQNKENQPESAPVPVNKELLLKKAKADIESKFQDTTNELIKLQELKQKGTPEWDQASAKYLELKFQKEKLNKMLGVEEKPIATSLDPVEQRDILIRKANSGKELTEQEIALYDELSLAIEKQKKQSEPVSPVVPEEPSLKPTERPLEAVKPAEVIPEPVRATEKPYEWDRSLEWKSDNLPDEQSWKILEDIRNEQRDLESYESVPREPKQINRDYTGRLFKLGTPEFAKHLDIQISRFEKMLENVEQTERDYKDGITPSGTLDEHQLESKRQWIEDKLNNTLYPLREQNLNAPKVEQKYSPVTKESLYNYKRNIAKQIVNLQNKINKLESQPLTENTQRQVLKLKDQISKRKQLMDQREKQFANQASRESLKDYEAGKEQSTDLPTIDTSLLDEQLGIPKTTSIDEIMDASAHPVKDFMDNPDFFDTIANSDTHIDKRLSEVAPNIAEAMDAFVKDFKQRRNSIWHI